MAGLAAWVPRGPCGPWLCLLVALALDVVRGQREGRGWAGPGVARARAGPVRRDAASRELRVPGLSSERVAPQLALGTGGLTTPPAPKRIFPPVELLCCFPHFQNLATLPNPAPASPGLSPPAHAPSASSPSRPGI